MRRTEIVGATKINERAKGGRTETAVVETLERVRRGVKGRP